jgi:hypothetical protein
MSDMTRPRTFEEFEADLARLTGQIDYDIANALGSLCTVRESLSQDPPEVGRALKYIESTFRFLRDVQRLLR